MGENRDIYRRGTKRTLGIKVGQNDELFCSDEVKERLDFLDSLPLGISHSQYEYLRVNFEEDGEIHIYPKFSEVIYSLAGISENGEIEIEEDLGDFKIDRDDEGGIENFIINKRSWDKFRRYNFHERPEEDYIYYKYQN